MGNNGLAAEVKGLVKWYGDLKAVDQVSFSVYRGEVFGLLGPNGAGKTTTLECLEGLRRPDGGALKVMGVDAVKDTRELLQVIGVQLQTGSLPGYLKVKELLKLFCAYHRVAPDEALLHRMGLGEKLNTPYHALSAGQKRKLDLALAVVHRPPVIFLDEPTAGLDVSSRATLHQLMEELRREGTTIIMSTHDMAEAENMADRVAILLRGRVEALGTPRELTATGGGYTKISVRTASESLKGASFPGVVQEASQGEYYVYFSTSPGDDVSRIISQIDDQGDQLIDLRVERPSLEERFLELTGRD